MEIYCRSDRRLICYLRTTEEHKDHNMVSNEAEITDEQNELNEVQMKSRQKIQEKQKKVQELKQTMDTIKMRSQAAVDDSEKIFTELISSMEKKRSEMSELIRAQEKAELSLTERLLNQLEQEIADLMRRVNEMEQSDPQEAMFLTNFSPNRSLQQNCVFPFTKCSSTWNSPSIIVNQHPLLKGMMKSLSDLKKQAEQISAAVQMILPSELESREEFMQYFSYLTLDPNTANHKLILSDYNRVVTFSDTEQQYSDHLDRFDSREQVLCKESVRRRHYWEVEWSGDDVYISVSYKEISRKGWGNECGFGRNSQSWSLVCSPSSVSFWHNDIKTVIKSPPSSRIGVYVDHSAGTLSFYSVCDTLRLLHQVHTTFTQPLYAGFFVWRRDSTVKLCDSEWF